jgi:hypothetical protein
MCTNGFCLNLSIPGCVPCELSYDCPPIDLVFIMDTSGSMRDEAAVLCAEIHSVGDSLPPWVSTHPSMPWGSQSCLMPHLIVLRTP